MYSVKIELKRLNYAAVPTVVDVIEASAETLEELFVELKPDTDIAHRFTNAIKDGRGEFLFGHLRTYAWINEDKLREMFSLYLTRKQAVGEHSVESDCDMAVNYMTTITVTQPMVSAPSTSPDTKGGRTVIIRNWGWLGITNNTTDHLVVHDGYKWYPLFGRLYMRSGLF